MSGIVDLHLPLSGLGPARMEAWTPDLLGIMEHWVEWLCFLFGYFVWFLMHTSRPSWLSLEWSLSILTVFNSPTLLKFSRSIFSLLFHAFSGCWYKNHAISSVIYHLFYKNNIDRTSTNISSTCYVVFHFSFQNIPLGMPIQNSCPFHFHSDRAVFYLKFFWHSCPIAHFENIQTYNTQFVFNN